MNKSNVLINRLIIIPPTKINGNKWLFLWKYSSFGIRCNLIIPKILEENIITVLNTIGGKYYSVTEVPKVHKGAYKIIRLCGMHI